MPESTAGPDWSSGETNPLFIDNLRYDFRFAIRQFARSPGFTAVIVITLAIGIGANVAVFSIMKGLILRPLSYPEPAEVVAVWCTDRGEQWYQPFSTPDFKDVLEQNSTMEAMGVYSWRWLNLSGDGEPERIMTAVCTAGLLRALDVQPAMGRLFLDRDEEPGTGRVAILCDGLWKQKYAADPEIIGKEITLNREEYTVVGVMPLHFEFPRTWVSAYETELLIPLDLTTNDYGRGSHWLGCVGRLGDDASIASATTDLQAIADRLSELYPSSNARKSMWMEPVMDRSMGGVRSSLVMLLGVVGLVLLVACANVASMLLGRSATRQVEVAVRASLGAGQGRLIRQFLTESVILSLLGGVVGVVLAVWGVDLIHGIIPANVPRVGGIEVDIGVLLFALLVTLLTGFIFGLAPALSTARTDLGSALREGRGGHVSGRRRNRTLSGLVVAQLAVALVLLNGAILFFLSYINVVRNPQGFDYEGVLTASVALVGTEYEENENRVAFWDGFLEQVEAIPGIEHAAVVTKLPFEGGTNFSLLVEGETYDPEAEHPLVEQSFISHDYFRAMGIPLLSGRYLEEGDTWGVDNVVVVNRAFVDEYWPEEDGVGKRLRDNSSSPEWTATIIGVVENVRQWGVTYPALPEIYALFPLDPWQDSKLVVRYRGEAGSIVSSIRASLYELDPQQPISAFRSVDDIISGRLERRRFITILVGLFAAAALALTLAGTYGVISYYVSHRTHEIGVRVALGAGRGSVLALVVGSGLKLAAIGVCIGLTGSVVSQFITRSLAFGISPINPLLLAGSTLLMVAVALLASSIPAVRATRVDPVRALQAE